MTLAIGADIAYEPSRTNEKYIMPTVRQQYREFMDRPMLHLLATMACNLRCSYCPVSDWLLEKPDDGLLEDPKILSLLDNASTPLAIHLGGGEPLLNPAVVDFVKHYGRQGHKFSFDTNGTHNAKRLASILEQWDPEWIGYFDVSHHLDQRVPLKTVMKNCEVLRSNGMHHFVKYIGRPSDREAIDDNVKQLEDAGVGVWVSVYLGPNTRGSGELIDDRMFPTDYSDEDLKWLLGHTRFRLHVPPLVGGFLMKGVACKGGNELALLGNFKKGSGVENCWPCCHGQNVPLDIDQTFFGGKPRGKVPCHVENACLVYFLFEHGLVDEREECLSDLFLGPVAPIASQKIIDYLEHTCSGIAPAADPALVDRTIQLASTL